MSSLGDFQEGTLHAACRPTAWESKARKTGLGATVVMMSTFPGDFIFPVLLGLLSLSSLK